MVTLNKPSAGDTDWATEINDNWSDLETEVINKTTIDAKGDLLAGTAADSISRLAVGSDGKVLIAEAAQTTGMKWDVLDHGTLSGLGDDDHTQYALLAGRSGGQTLIGGTASANTLTLRATSNSAGGDLILQTDSSGEAVRIVATSTGGYFKATQLTNGERMRCNGGSANNQSTLLFTRNDAFKLAMGHANASSIITGAAIGPQFRSFTSETWSFSLDGSDAVDMTWAVSANVLTLSTGTSMAMELKALTTFDIYTGGSRRVRVLSSANTIQGVSGLTVQGGTGVDTLTLSGGTGTASIVDIQSAATDKIGLYGTTAVVQHSSTGQTSGFTAGSGTGVNDDSTFTGGSGTKAYTIGDIVLALKNIGAMAAS